MSAHPARAELQAVERNHARLASYVEPERACAWCSLEPAPVGTSHFCCPECEHLMGVSADLDETDAQLICRAVRMYGRAVSDAELRPSRWTLDRRDRAYARVVSLVHRECAETGRLREATEIALRALSSISLARELREQRWTLRRARAKADQAFHAMLRKLGRGHYTPPNESGPTGA